ncbi:MAG: lycopene cyclase [Chitinophagaceae bacterium]|nr:lycopene cyclase [Chitinophagaceae bacterium]
MNASHKYDYIIAGAGCAGLSLLVRLIASGRFADKRILLLDNKSASGNEKTWCFWEETRGYFEELVHKEWDTISFKSKHFVKEYNIAPYRYKMIKGGDFFTHCHDIIRQHNNITIVQGTIENLSGKTGDTWVQYDGIKATADYIFNSILFQTPPLRKKEILLLQHFKGWFVETFEPVFNPRIATFMDFRTSQHHGAAFVYVMPFTAHQALVEYTLFTASLLEPKEYEAGIRDYMNHFYPSVDYKILQQEFGIIPMTNHPFPSANGNVIHIGTAGGQTKASTGYTFQFIQKHSEALVNALIKGRPLSGLSPSTKKFSFYDSVLLNVLATNKVPGDKVFTQLFRKNDAKNILRFLDNQTSFSEDLRIITSLPIFPFFKAATEQIYKV